MRKRSPSRYLSTAGTGAWSGNFARRFADRSYGSAVMYDFGKILYAGGGFVTNTAEIIDLTKAPASWQWTGSMAYARRHLNLTVLPTGEVLATGGTGGTTGNDLTQAAHAAEVWNPSTGQWTTLASNVVSRGYHATSILLPDGRVLHSGSGDAADQVDERNAEIFSPPYLFHGPRPVITAAPPELHYGTYAKVSTPDPAAITRVTLIRLGAATHAFDMGQRFQQCRSAGRRRDQASLPTSRNRTPPGHYMLFLLNRGRCLRSGRSSWSSSGEGGQGFDRHDRAVLAAEPQARVLPVAGAAIDREQGRPRARHPAHHGMGGRQRLEGRADLGVAGEDRRLEIVARHPGDIAPAGERVEIERQAPRRPAHSRAASTQRYASAVAIGIGGVTTSPGAAGRAGTGAGARPVPTQRERRPAEDRTARRSRAGRRTGAARARGHRVVRPAG